ncbi:MAG: hypothetical protein A2293_16110 [Elusimicrobia bacterium RIFOXYB2_FULL_49_7]|nr:MAG: hypothetical protein A2293_16110 [Elusimicrobia bacterium RIFOXYB2_FULL_49_7]
MIPKQPLLIWFLFVLMAIPVLSADSENPSDTVGQDKRSEDKGTLLNLQKDSSEARGDDKTVNRSGGRIGAAFSPTFVLNTADPEKDSIALIGNGAQFPLFLVGEYQVAGQVRVTIQAYRDSRMVRRLLDEQQVSGKYPIYWDGTDDAGAKLEGDLTILVIQNNGTEKTKQIKFNVKLEKKK